MSDRPTTPDNFFSAVPVEIKDAIKARLPKLKSVETMGGRFTVDDLKKGGIPAPAVLVSLTRIRTAKEHLHGAYKYEMQLTAFVVTKDALGLDRDTAALNICHALIGLIQGNHFENDYLGPAEKPSAESLINAKVKAFTQSLWAVSWTQPFVMHGQSEGAVDPALYIDLHVNGEKYDRKTVEPNDTPNEGGSEA